MHADSEVWLVYCIEVPRAFAMAAMLPGEEAMADDVLATGAVTVENYGCKVTTEIQRGLDFSETLIKYAAQHSADLIVLGARSDGLRGLPLHVAREVYDRMTVPVILDFFAGASNAKPSSDQLPLDSPSLEA